MRLKPVEFEPSSTTKTPPCELNHCSFLLSFLSFEVLRVRLCSVAIWTPTLQILKAFWFVKVVVQHGQDPGKWSQVKFSSSSNCGLIPQVFAPDVKAIRSTDWDLTCPYSQYKSWWLGRGLQVRWNKIWTGTNIKTPMVQIHIKIIWEGWKKSQILSTSTKTAVMIDLTVFWVWSRLLKARFCHNHRSDLCFDDFMGHETAKRISQSLQEDNTAPALTSLVKCLHVPAPQRDLGKIRRFCLVIPWLTCHKICF